MFHIHVRIRNNNKQGYEIKRKTDFINNKQINEICRGKTPVPI